MARWPGFIGGFGVAQSLIGSGEDTVNMYVEKLPQSGENAAALFPTPGFKQWGSVTDVGTRAMLSVTSLRLFTIIGASLYEFNSAMVATKRGTVLQDSNPAQIIFNGVLGGQLGIASGGGVYSYDLNTNTLTGPYLTGVTHLAYAGAYGLAFNPTTGKVNLSNLQDFTVWDPGTFFQRSLFADPWLTLFVDQNNLVWLIGRDTFEVWYNTGQGTQPWAPLSGLVGLTGIVAPFAYAAGPQGNVWLSSNQQGQGQLVASTGSAPQSVSTYTANTAVAKYLRAGTIANAEVLAYQQEGHVFVNVTFPTQGATLTYDTTESNWARRGKWVPNNGAYTIWQPRCHCMAFGKHLVGDRATGVISEMDTNIATELDGSGIRRLRRAPALVAELRRVPIDDVQLLMDVGVGAQSGQGSDPQAMLRVSDDGGVTWGNEITSGIGRVGEYLRRVYWTRLGIRANAAVELTFSDPVPFRVVDAFVNNLENPGR